MITLSAKGRITIPKRVREALDLKTGSKLRLQVRDQEIVLTKEPAWQQLAGRGALLGKDLLREFANFRRDERLRESGRH